MRVQSLSYKHDRSMPYFFQDLSFELGPGRLHALHGKNGVGKSVLLHILSNRILPEAVVEGAITGAKNVRLVNQRFDQMIADQFSFEENLQLARMGRFPKLACQLQAPITLPDCLSQFHIDIHMPVHKLSGGQRQILALLMVLQKDVDVLLLDEPTATLDEENAAIVFAFLKRLTAASITLLVVCHDRDLLTHHTTGKHLELSLAPAGLRSLNIHY